MKRAREVLWDHKEMMGHQVVKENKVLKVLWGLSDPQENQLNEENLEAQVHRVNLELPVHRVNVDSLDHREPMVYQVHLV